ncbi:MAG: hypothetical protein A3G18_09455 [Rhodospirillales bacterium RIFCSPLOWO2_12_FULL_58_28]|nr:MAG: hypothetical protein A3H92_02215 [Rhodospirillales bacterium RIFCSPLOWO2_02_FULL_58_16]OHC76730.1 MAG: hypothetical protein A3G18_09455 [Rhodospirillales bacterium RIFCSPLOWO2_12_FULL_58_28]
MKALVVGFGSSGARHARILADMGLNVAVASRRVVSAAKVYPTIPMAAADWKPDYVVIAGRTGEHRSDFAALAGTGFRGKVLVEKPLFDGPATIPEHQFAGVHVAYNLRFHPVINRLRGILKQIPPLAVHAYVGQYLPKWRPETDYRLGYSAHKAEGGGALRDLSHELDYLNRLLGGWTGLTAAGGRFSRLEIDSDDIFSILFKTRDCPIVSLQMNYLDSTPSRNIIVLTDNGSIRADLIAGTIDFAGETESLQTERDATYIAEHKAALAGENDIACSLDEGLEALHMIAAAEKAALENVWVTK